MSIACSGVDPNVAVQTYHHVHPPTAASPSGDASDTAAVDAGPSLDAAAETISAGDLGDAGSFLDIDLTSDSGADAVDAESDADLHDTANSELCQIGARMGNCVPLDECASPNQAVEGLCDGHPLIRCCIEAEDRCSSDGVTGACFTTQDCAPPGFSAAAGLCPGAADVLCCHPNDRENTCTNNDFPVPTPNLNEAAGDPGCPRGMARVAGFCIDRFEASLVRDDASAVVLTPFGRPAAATPVRALSARHAVPQGYVDGHTAGRACVAAGKRLCTSTEWLRACRGAENRLYPYGATRQPGRCNDARRRHPALEYFQSNEPWVWSSLGHPCISQLPDSVHLTGEDAGCVTPEGVFDLVGNLHEWVDDPDGTFRGGFYADTQINGEGCLYRTTAHSLGHWDYSTGFRCCADPTE